MVITTHDDDVNVYLAIYCRLLRPDIQVIARANLDRNVSTLYRAGADAVLSYASTGADAIWNKLRPEHSLLLAEGLEVFRAPASPELVGLPMGIPDDPRPDRLRRARADRRPRARLQPRPPSARSRSAPSWC